MSISQVISGRIAAGMASAANASSRSADAAARSVPAPASSTDSADRWTQPTSPPRFPWLSRAALQLDQAEASKRQPFKDASVLGDHLDEAA